MRVGIYARVSTDEQDVETQLVALREHCNRMNYNVVDEYIDSGFSGKDANRPQFERLLFDVRNRRVDCIIAWKIDRIGRSLAHLINFLQELRNRRVGFISVTESIDTSTAQGELFWNIFGAFAQFERSMIIERTKAGLERAKRQGKALGRPKGSRDKKVRKKSGYYLRWAGNKKTPPRILAKA